MTDQAVTAMPAQGAIRGRRGKHAPGPRVLTPKIPTTIPGISIICPGTTTTTTTCPGEGELPAIPGVAALLHDLGPPHLLRAPHHRRGITTTADVIHHQSLPGRLHHLHIPHGISRAESGMGRNITTGTRTPAEPGLRTTDPAPSGSGELEAQKRSCPIPESAPTAPTAATAATAPTLPPLLAASPD